MAYPYFCSETIDDLMRYVIEGIRSEGERVQASKGECKELRGVLLEVSSPRARISRTETRGKPFSCLGELCWYLSGINELGFIAYYLPSYQKSADGDVIFGGYGPRLFNWGGLNQWDHVESLLRRRSTSRQAVIQLFDAWDIAEEHKDIPCTCTLQFMVRNGKLHMFTSMRSNDVTLGLPHDVFSFTMLQEIMARTLAVELGIYKHYVGSLHLYTKNEEEAQRFLDEGWQTTEISMPPMPLGNPWPAIKLLLKAEAAMRSGMVDPQGIQGVKELDSYWGDLIRLLQVLRLTKNKDTDGMEKLVQQISSSAYRTFVLKKLETLKRADQKREDS